MPIRNAMPSKGKDVQPYKYNGKEFDLMHGLNTYDYGARQHDPILARWDRIDPLCEKYRIHIVRIILKMKLAEKIFDTAEEKIDEKNR